MGEGGIAPAGAYVPVDYFRNGIDGSCYNDYFIVQRRDVNGDGILDEAGYPDIPSCGAYRRPYTLWDQNGPTDTVNSGDKQSVCRRYVLLEKKEAIKSLEEYAVRFWRAFKDLDTAAKAKIAAIVLEYMRRPNEEPVRKALSVLNAHLPPYGEFPKLSGAQLDLLARLIHSRRDILEDNFASMFGTEPYRLAMELKSKKGAANPLADSLYNAEARVIAGALLGQGHYGHHFDFHVSSLAALDALFGELAVSCYDPY